MNGIIRNFIIILLTLLLTIISLFVFKKVLEFLFKYAEKFAYYITHNLILKLKCKNILVLSELCTFIVPLIPIIIFRKSLNKFFSFEIYLGLMIFFSLIIVT